MATFFAGSSNTPAAVSAARQQTRRILCGVVEINLRSADYNESVDPRLAFLFENKSEMENDIIQYIINYQTFARRNVRGYDQYIERLYEKVSPFDEDAQEEYVRLLYPISRNITWEHISLCMVLTAELIVFILDSYAHLAPAFVLEVLQFCDEFFADRFYGWIIENGRWDTLYNLEIDPNPRINVREMSQYAVQLLAGLGLAVLSLYEILNLPNN